MSLNEVTLGNWVREERRRLGALAGTESEPLSAVERAELMALRRRVSEQEKDLEFLGKAAACFASNPPKRKGSR